MTGLRAALAALAFGLAACGTAPGVETQAVEGRGSDAAAWWEKLPRAEWGAYERVEADLYWFEVYRIFPDVYAIYEPGQFEEVISFLLVGEDAALLFDTGLGIGTVAPVVARLTDKPVRVLNSHTHYDHIGGNHEFSDIVGLDHPYAEARRAGAAHEAVAEFVEGDWVWKPFPDGFDPQTYHIRPFDIGAFVEDGDVINLGGLSLEVIETPGHSPDSICLLDRGNRRLFMGDTFYPAALYAHIEGADFDAYAASIERLSALEPLVDHLVTSHNTPVSDAAYLSSLKGAFDAVEAGEHPFIETDGAREYKFDGFSIIAPGDG